MKKLKVMCVFGTRPEAIKMLPLIRELESREQLECVVCVTAQHRELLDCVLRCFGLTPDYDLDIMSGEQSLSDITARVLAGLEKCFADARPDLVLVHGDTSTAFAAALAAFYAKIPVGHVEAGLRTNDIYSPFPEEANRGMISRLAALNFAPTEKNAENLRKENCPGEIFVTGNTVIDAMRISPCRSEFCSPELRDVDFRRRVVTLTCHRRENYGEPMENIFSAVCELAKLHSELTFVYPVHSAPEVKAAAVKNLGGVENIKLISPLDAIDMRLLMSRSYMIMTDSGGLQEEAPALGKPVLLLRRETERPEAVEAGTVRLCGVNRADIIREAELLLTDSGAYERMAQAASPYGDGHASERIADAIIKHFGLPDNN